MRRESLNFLVNNIKLPVSASVKEAFSVAMGRLKKLGIRASETDCTVFRRSIDARKKDNILFVYSISVNFHQILILPFLPISALREKLA